MTSKFPWLILGVLSVFRLTHLLNAEDGPWNLVVHLRRLAGQSILGQAMDCFYCLSLWVALPFAVWFGNGVGEWFLFWLSLSAGAIVVERLTGSTRAAPAPYWEEGERSDVLRKEETNPDQRG